MVYILEDMLEPIDTCFKNGTIGNTNMYEDGFGYKFGGTIGYEKKINDRLMLDFFVGGGWH